MLCDDDGNMKIFYWLKFVISFFYKQQFSFIFRLFFFLIDSFLSVSFGIYLQTQLYIWEQILWFNGSYLLFLFIGSLVRPKVVKSVHFCPTTGSFTSREYRDITSNLGLPTGSVYPTRVISSPLISNIIIITRPWNLLTTALL